jgi:hypothetical protein
MTETLPASAIVAERAAFYGDAPSGEASGLARAAELATEAVRMVAAVRAASTRLVLEDEPANFLTVLRPPVLKCGA